MMTIKRLVCGAVLMGTAFSSAVSAEEKVLNIYNWADYIDSSFVEAFEKDTGIKINHDYFDSNEVLEAKLMAGGSGYDVVHPSSVFLERQAQASVYAPIDKSKLSNYGNLDSEMLEILAEHDPGNTYGVPYTWGTVGIGYNVEMVAERLGDQPVDTWDLIFNPEIAAKLADCGLTVLEAPAEMVSIALHYLGLDPNSESKADLKKAKVLLSTARPHFKYFHSSKFISDLANGETCVAVGYNGDVLVSQGNADAAGQGVQVDFAIPREGTLVWFDSMAIPADAPHPQAAHLWIDYVLDAKVGASVTNYVYFAVPNKAAEEFIDAEVLAIPGIFPAEDVKAKLFAQNAHTIKYDRLLTRAWSNIKSGR